MPTHRGTLTQAWGSPAYWLGGAVGGSTPGRAPPTHRGTLTQAWVSPAYWLVDALVTSTSVSATSTPSAARLDRVVWKLPGSELPPVKWVCRPTQSIGTPRDLKSWIMR